MLTNRTAIPAFPTLIWRQKVEPARTATLDAELLAALDELLTPRPSVPPGQGWQTGQDLHKLPRFRPLVEVANEVKNGTIVISPRGSPASSDSATARRNGFRSPSASCSTTTRTPSPIPGGRPMPAPGSDATRAGAARPMREEWR